MFDSANKPIIRGQVVSMVIEIERRTDKYYLAGVTGVALSDTYTPDTTLYDV